VSECGPSFWAPCRSIHDRKERVNVSTYKHARTLRLEIALEYL
jgi:hypothetical protein